MNTLVKYYFNFMWRRSAAKIQCNIHICHLDTPPSANTLKRTTVRCIGSFCFKSSSMADQWEAQQRSRIYDVFLIITNYLQLKAVAETLRSCNQCTFNESTYIIQTQAISLQLTFRHRSQHKSWRKNCKSRLKKFWQLWKYPNVSY